MWQSKFEFTIHYSSNKFKIIRSFNWLPTSLPPVPTFDAYPSSKKLNPKEFAMKMSMERRIAMGELDGANAASAGRKLIQMDKESEMFTTKPLYRKCSVVEKFLHDRPPALSSVSLITCTILEESCFPRASPTILPSSS